MIKAMKSVKLRLNTISIDEGSITVSFDELSPVPELYVSYDSAQKLKAEAADLPSYDLSCGKFAIWNY